MSDDSAETPVDGTAPTNGTSVSDAAIDGGFRKRVLLLPVAAAVIIGLCAWKLSQPISTRTKNREITDYRQSPRFELIDQAKRLVKFERYLSRHRIVLVFFDSKLPPDQDERLLKLRANLPILKRYETVVVGVSGGLPQENRRGTEFPFPLLTDLVQREAGSHYQVHKQWGSYDETADQPEFKMYLIDRKGTVAWDDGKPRAIDNSITVINALINGQDPGV